MPWIKRTLLALLTLFVVGFIAIQLAPVNRSNPPIVSEPAWNSPHTRELAQRACFDCHSHETKWPWYSYVAPASWLIARDVREGRGELNFSTWRPGMENETAEVIRNGKMPMPIYLVLHPKARLTSTEKQDLIKGLNATLGAGEREGEDD